MTKLEKTLINSAKTLSNFAKIEILNNYKEFKALGSISYCLLLSEVHKIIVENNLKCFNIADAIETFVEAIENS